MWCLWHAVGTSIAWPGQRLHLSRTLGKDHVCFEHFMLEVGTIKGHVPCAFVVFLMKLNIKLMHCIFRDSSFLSKVSGPLQQRRASETVGQV